MTNLAQQGIQMLAAMNLCPHRFDVKLGITQQGTSGSNARDQFCKAGTEIVSCGAREHECFSVAGRGLLQNST